ncbi:MAG: 16S rRNA (uracil(1498)-N(3))-methyltransferase [Elusimicrobiota bacterium]|jgi:16S rRNA (uracil1498-N3)-methyltransferase|nr:16S rRNA (uracil(1498)-N(3))-methyltransferase [Elusimicrobiota bacterium]
MPHFFIKPSNISNGVFIMDDEQVHYLAKVRRVKAGDEIMIFDGQGNSYRCQITSVSKKEISGKILSASFTPQEFEINLYVAIPKGDRFGWLIEKCAELGVLALCAINTARSVKTELSKSKLDHLNKISIAASSQCGRSDIMKISPAIDFDLALKQSSDKKGFINIVPWEGEESCLISDLQQGNKPMSVNIFIGPEGGFENKEIERVKALGFKTVTLGKNILRVETAALTTAVLITFINNSCTIKRRRKK